MSARKDGAMSPVEVKDGTTCDFDLVSLGEVMLRLDPGEGRIRTARSFHAWEGEASTTSLAV